jgi:hypothetical protein
MGHESEEEVVRAVSQKFEVKDKGLYRPRGFSRARFILMELWRVHSIRRMIGAEFG